PSYTKSVSWQHHLKPKRWFCLLQLIATILMLIIFYRGFPATSRGAVKPHKNKVGYSGWE
ncbi:TPA: hypothetical protein ACHF0P_004781, partial [Escherichia coli]